MSKERVYTSSTCAPCKTLKEECVRRGYKVEFILIDNLGRSQYPPNLRAVPTLITNEGTTIVGDSILPYLEMKEDENV